MTQAQFNLEESEIEFLDRFQEYGFRAPRLRLRSSTRRVCSTRRGSGSLRGLAKRGATRSRYIVTVKSIEFEIKPTGVFEA